MGYRFEHGESIPEAVGRVAAEEIEAIRGGLDDPGPDEIVDAVHEARKSCKKLRALARLVRPAIGDSYGAANRAFSDAARELSAIRDAQALLETYDDLIAAAGAVAAQESASAVREGLARRAAEASDQVLDEDRRVGRAVELVGRGAAAVARWDVPDDTGPLEIGIAKTYGRGRKRLAECRKQPSDEALHQWRKRAKYSWYQVRLLEDAAPSVLMPLADAFHNLSDVLGDDHDLAVLVGQLRSDPDQFGGVGPVGAMLPAIEGRRADMQRRSLSLGPRLYAEKPKACAARIRSYLRIWRERGPELEAGEIAELHAPAGRAEERLI